MKVSELISELQKHPPNMEVAVSKDEEGNGFKLLYQVSVESMERYGRQLDFSESDKAKEYAVLWPMG